MTPMMNRQTPRRPVFQLCSIAVLLVALFAGASHAGTVSYTYDSRHRLTSAAYEDGTTIRYTYDIAGNRLSTASTLPVYRGYEDAEDGSIIGWDIYDNDPAGATVSNVYDNDRASRVIEFAGSATANGYRLRNADGSYWNDTQFRIFEWSMRSSESFVVYIAVQTKNGFRYLYYTPVDTDSLGTETYIHHGLGSHIKDGQWHTLVRDLARDLKEAQPDNELQAVLGFLIRGNGRVDDIKTRKEIPADLDSDGDGLIDVQEIATYGTSPYDADSDGDGIVDKDELVYWGANWNDDPDGDGLINLLDPDADNDGFTDGVEIGQGTDPADPAVVPAAIVYEDAEDGLTVGWDIYDNDPAGATVSNVYNTVRVSRVIYDDDPVGATVSNVYDSDRASRVIEFAGNGTENGYRLRNADGSYWNDTWFKILEWSMRYSESFVVYIAVQTKNGFRYLYYTPVDTDSLGTETYIHHGLGSHIKDGQWHTLVRDLARDLKEAQPDNELQAVLGFLIRGSGRVDDIRTRQEIPANLDSDGDGLTDVMEISTYGTSPYDADSDGDDIADKDEQVYWGANWNADPDGDGLINLLDPDADNDGFTDGVEIGQGTDPLNAASKPTAILYEDAEDGAIIGWDIYDNGPVGATVSNVYDNDRASWVIEFAGNGTENGYRLRNAVGSYWNDTQFKILEWSMRYSESFVVYIAVQTKNGFRYLYYTSVDTDNLGTETYIHHGLGSHIKDGQWHTLVRDLARDLKEAQPDNELQAVLGFLIRGSGRVDDVKSMR